MLYIFPDYYNEFKCINSKCRHNCCIGWEIDIDSDTLDYYDTVQGKIGRRLNKNIDRGSIPHFILDEKERCPFLNDLNLCDIIIELGEEHICDICTDHPRFRNELPGRIETGLGLCCEEAARLILGKKESVKFDGINNSDDDIIILRNKIISVLQNRAKAIPDRIADMLLLCDTSLPDKSLDEWIDILLSLERLDPKWTQTLLTLKEKRYIADFEMFDSFMIERQPEYEQLLVYFIYRHFANAYDMTDAAARACFAAFGYFVMRAIGAVMYSENRRFVFEDQIEISRMFSSEIEYSQENLDYLLDKMI